jgi:type IV pilus assembly protein PilC
MAKFAVKFVDATGVTHKEMRESTDEAAIYADVKQRGDTLISVTEAALKGKLEFSIPFLKRKVKMRDKIVFSRNLGSMIDAGLALSRALAVSEKQTKQKKFKSVIASLGRSISQGKTLSDGMKEYPDTFPALMTSMVRAGEESGSLSQALRTMSLQMENSYNLTRKIKGALMYPSIILIAMVGIGFFMLTYVVPTLSATFKELHADLPITTKIVIGLSDFLKGHIIISLVGIVAVVFGFYTAAKTKKGKRFLDYAFLKIPVIGMMVKEINAARTARTLSSLLSAGVDVVVATKITADVLQNSYYKEVMAIVEEKIQKGDPIAHVFAEREHLYPVFVSEMISVGEETGQLAQMLLGVATFYESDIDQKTKDMSSIIEPFLMVFIGIAVGFFAVSMIMPIYSLGNNI